MSTNKVKKIVAIVQSSYIPWKGYFDLINSVDEFVLYDDVQFTKRDWRSRNAIKTANGQQWLTVPVNVKGKYLQKINEVTVAEADWTEKHWNSLCQHYKKAAFFSNYAELIKANYKALANEQYLSQINYSFIKLICKILQINTKITWSMDYSAIGSKTERLVSLCNATDATHYISGPAARDYMKPELFEEANIELSYFKYENYPEYNQLHDGFNHFVTVFDLLFNVGEKATDHMISFDKNANRNTDTQSHSEIVGV